MEKKLLVTATICRLCENSAIIDPTVAEILAHQAHPHHKRRANPITVLSNSAGRRHGLRKDGLAHTLRNLPNCQISAHLLIPGFTYTGNAAKRIPVKPAAAWTAEQVADRLIEELERNEFYILCQDNETTRDQDERRILWAAGDLVENRPALSRWHPDYKDAFEAFMRMPRSTSNKE